MKKRVMLILSCLFLSIGFLAAQTKTITGTIVDEIGEPVIGASVVVKGTTVGVSTDVEGKFKIEMPGESNILVFSLIGMTPIERKASAGMRVVMTEDVKGLEEVVVIGYGSGRKISSVTGTVTRVSGEKVEMKPIGNAMDMLQGQVAGLSVSTDSGEPGSLSSIKIRGVGSLTTGSDPLIVLDGIVTSSDAMLTVNSNDIENVVVMKDAGATSIYGSRAANGVIYITTKRGQAGKTTVQVSANYGVSELARKLNNQMNTKEVADIKLRNKVMDPARYDEIMASGVDMKWSDFFFSDNARTRQINTSISGGNDKATYYLSAGLFNQEGISIGSEYEKYNFRSNVDAKAKSWLRVGLTVGGYYAKRKTSLYTYLASGYLAGGVFGSALNAPYYSPYDKDGKDLDYIPGVGYSTKYLSKVRPRNISDAQVNISEYVEIKPLEGLTFLSKAGVEANDYRQTDKVLPGSPANPSTSVSERFGRGTTLNIINTIEYNFSLSDQMHNFGILAGQDATRYKYDGFSAQTTGQSDSRLTMLQHGTTAVLMGVNREIGMLKARGNRKSEYVYSSFLGRVNYNYNEKYFADFTVRNDGSSRFGKDSRYATFFSGSVMWDLKKEDFLKNRRFLTDLRAKFSVGSQGNSDLETSTSYDGNYAFYDLVGTANYGGNSGWSISQAGNSKLKWETQILTNFTVNAGFFNNDYTVELSLYNRKTKDMLLNVPIPYSTGFYELLQNAGEMTNRGFELTLAATPIKTKDWVFTVNANVSYNKERIDELFYGYKQWPMHNYLTSYNVGSATNFYMVKFAGIDSDTGEQMWYIPGTNQTTKDFDEETLSQDTGKKLNAPYAGGFGFTLKWKDLTLSSQFSMILDKYIVNNDAFFTHNPSFLAGDNNASKDMITQMWEKPGDTGKKYPKIGTQLEFDDRLLQNSSFLRLKDLTLSYNVPAKYLDYSKVINSVRIYGTARNLFTITPYGGSDPEINSNLTYGKYPASRQFIIGVDLTF